MHTFSHKEENQHCLHQENLFLCSQIHKTNYSTCATSLLSTVLLPISSKKLHLKAVISRTSHPQSAWVTCSLFSELEMIFAIKNWVTSLHSNILKLDVCMICSPGFLLPGKKAAESSDWGQDSSHLNFSSQDWASCLSQQTQLLLQGLLRQKSIPWRVLPLPTPHLTWESNRTNYARMKYEKLYIQKGQPRTGSLLDQQSCHEENKELQPEFPYENHLLFFFKQCWSLRSVWRLQQSYFSGVVWQHKEDFMFSPGASRAETEAWLSGIHSVTILTFLWGSVCTKFN